MVEGTGKCRSFFHVGLEELVSKVLGKEGKHEARALRVRDEVSPQQKFLCQHLSIGQLLLACNQEEAY